MPSRSSSITPQRKHRKLLKDGSGSEVWPEAVEKIFVQGLRQYWDSPWATYSRGRSRWRNQFLVDHLQKAGIERTKKQVASHMQVLRNMWKGEPEFHLVAGGEELFLESGLLATTGVKKEDSNDSNSLIPIETVDDSESSVSPSTPNFPFHDLSPSPPQLNIPIKRSPPRSNPILPPTAPPAPPPSPPTTSSSFIYEHNTPKVVPQLVHPFTLQYRNSYPPDSTHINPKLGHLPPIQTGGFPSVPAHQGPISSLSPPPFGRISSLSLLAEGMAPFHLSIDDLRSPGANPSPITLHVHLSLPPIDDIHTLPTLHGFQVAVTFNAAWSSSGKCLSKVYTANIGISEEVETLQLVASNPPSLGDTCQMTAFLTESPLSRSRWFDATLQTSITQEFFIDQELMAFIVYDLHRGNPGSLPAAELAGLQNYRPQTRTPVIRPPPPCFTYPTAYGLYPHPQHARFRRMDHTSMSCAPPPVNATPPLLASFNTPLTSP